MLRFTICLNLICLCGMISGQNAVSTEILNIKSAGHLFEKVPLMKFESNNLQNRATPLKGAKKGTIFTLDRAVLQSLLMDDKDLIQLQMPVTSNTHMTLTLKRHEIFAPDFRVFTSVDPHHPLAYRPGLHYVGMVDNDQNSLVALSVFEDHVAGMIATDAGNFTIGLINHDTQGRHVFYNERDLDGTIEFRCSTEDDGVSYTIEQLKPQPGNRDPDDCLRVHFEVNHDVVAAKGGAVQATDFVTAVFNQMAVIYLNDQINTVISEIFVWTTTSPYTGSNSQAMLNSFKAYTEYFNGDISHLLSMDSTYGGVASGLVGLCATSPDNSKCYSGLRFSYYDFPVYSQPLYLFAHEMGHLLGSRHTHACAWNGNGTAIDGCPGYVEGSCDVPGLPPNGGTVMSYCHPATGSFINFNEGFGEQPGNLIRNGINAAGNCLTPCGQPTSYCASNGVSSTNDYINKVVLGSINNTSGNNGGYADYTSLSTNLQAGNTYTITLNPKPQNGGHTDCWKVWIDYNNDFDWYDTGELVGSGSGKQAVNITFTVPAGSPAAITRMRVSMRYLGCPAFCGTFPTGEVEDYTIVILPNTPTCSDGIQNQGETGIDCGGICPACPTCDDGIQNQGEQGIDCGGPCAGCETSDSTILLGAYFETGWDSWNDGGPDVNRVTSANSFEGSYSIKLADNSGVQSAMTSPAFDLSNVVGLQISFHFYASSMESGEDFWVSYNNGSGNWVTVGTYTSGSSFNNNAHYASTVTIPNFSPTSAGSLRIQCDASDNNDQVFIDAVVITALNGTEYVESGMTLSEVHPLARPIYSSEEDRLLFVYPNPVKDVLNISFDGEIQTLRLFSLQGIEVKSGQYDLANRQLNIGHLIPGMYFLKIVSDEQVTATCKFLKQ